MKIVFTSHARREWVKIDAHVQQMIYKKLSLYIRSDRPLEFAKKLKNLELGEYRFRIGDWRIVFDVHNDLIVILRVGHRKDIYK